MYRCLEDEGEEKVQWRKRRKEEGEVVEERGGRKDGGEEERKCTYRRLTANDPKGLHLSNVSPLCVYYCFFKWFGSNHAKRG